MNAAFKFQNLASNVLKGAIACTHGGFMCDECPYTYFTDCRDRRQKDQEKLFEIARFLDKENNSDIRIMKNEVWFKEESDGKV